MLLATLLSLGERSMQLPEPGTAVWELSRSEMQWLLSGINFMKQKVRIPIKNGILFLKK